MTQTTVTADDVLACINELPELDQPVLQAKLAACKTDRAREKLRDEAKLKLIKLQAKEAKHLKKVADAATPVDGEDGDPRYQKALENVATFLQNPKYEELYFVRKDNRFYRYETDGDFWIDIPKDNFRGSHSLIRGEIEFPTLMTVLEDGDRIYDDRTYTFKAPSRSLLNLMKTAHWLKPQEGQMNEFFEFLLYSVGNGKDENIRHIMEVIGWKYLHPETWQLPCLCFYGRGGSGKNLLNKTVMSTIFGDHQVLVTKFKHIERFDAALAGKVWVNFDEHPQQDDQSTIKSRVGQPTLTVEPKGSSLFDIDNTPLYTISSNKPEGPIRLEKNGTDRRWSMLRSDVDLQQVVMDKKGITKEEAFELIKLIDKTIFNNPDEVSKFLHACVQAATARGTSPAALHGDDYEELVQDQKQSIDHLIEEIFVEYQGFDYILLNTLYDLYKLKLKIDNPAQAPMGKSKFSSAVGQFLNQNLKDIVKERAFVRTTDGVLQRLFIYRLAPIVKEVPDNSMFYFQGEHLRYRTPEQTANVVKLRAVATAINNAG